MATSNTAQNITLLLGRIFLSLIFIIAGIDKIIHFQWAVQAINVAGLPLAEALTVIALFFELIGGLMVFFGWKTRIGAWLLVIFIVAVSVIFHQYWNEPTATAANQVHHFMKNVSMLGGMLYIIACGAGKFSFDGK